MGITSIIMGFIGALGIGSSITVYIQYKLSIEAQKKERVYNQKKEAYVGFIEAQAGFNNISKRFMSYCKDSEYSKMYEQFRNEAATNLAKATIKMKLFASEEIKQKLKNADSDGMHMNITEEIEKDLYSFF